MWAPSQQTRLAVKGGAGSAPDRGRGALLDGVAADEPGGAREDGLALNEGMLKSHGGFPLRAAGRAPVCGFSVRPRATPS